MTDNDKSTIQRMLGKIEGAAMVIEDLYASPIFDALEVLDCIFDREEDTENGNTEKDC
jgi:hypothetical protein